MCVAAPVSGVCAHVNDQTACLTRSERKRDKEHTSSGERVKLLGGGGDDVDYDQASQTHTQL